MASVERLLSWLFSADMALLILSASQDFIFDSILQQNIIKKKLTIEEFFELLLPASMNWPFILHSPAVFLALSRSDAQAFTS